MDGDGVNIAARLEPMCDAGGIMVSENVYKLSHKQLAFGYDFAGHHTVKEGEEPVAGYRVRVGGSNRLDDDEKRIKWTQFPFHQTNRQAALIIV